MPPSPTTPAQAPAVVLPPARTASLAEFLAFLVSVVCLVCLTCVGAQASAEPPATEPPGEVLESGGDDDDETGVADHLPLHYETSDEPPPWALARLEPERRTSPAAGWLAAVGQGRLVGPPPLVPIRFTRPPSHACASHFFLATVPTRGPTILG